MTRHFVLETPPERYYSEDEVRRYLRTFAQWRAQGGLLVLPPGARLVAFDVAHPLPPEGVSQEAAAWAEEVRWTLG
jgi:hypothetical protein